MEGLARVTTKWLGESAAIGAPLTPLPALDVRHCDARRIHAHDTIRVPEPERNLASESPTGRVLRLFCLDRILGSHS